MPGPKPKWQPVHRDDDRETLRLKVRRGWLYLIADLLEPGRTCVCFAPDDQAGDREQRPRVPRA